MTTTLKFQLSPFTLRTFPSGLSTNFPILLGNAQDLLRCISGFRTLGGPGLERFASRILGSFLGRACGGAPGPDLHLWFGRSASYCWSSPLACVSPKAVCARILGNPGAFPRRVGPLDLWEAMAARGVLANPGTGDARLRCKGSLRLDSPSAVFMPGCAHP